MRTTSIHRALGVDLQRDLDLDLIEQACADRVREDDHLDWKRVITDQYEFVKDVAAFANAQGGLLVYGVAEDKHGAAGRVQPIAVDDKTVRMLRGWAHQQISPPLPDLRIEARPLESDPGVGVLLVEVPASVDMPHMVGKDRNCGWPFRVGTRIEWMREYDLERAYRQRFDRYTRVDERLDLMLDQAADDLLLTRAPWLVAAALPTAPNRYPSPPTAPDVSAMVSYACAHREDVLAAPTWDDKILTPSLANTRHGLRRWIGEDRSDTHPASGSRSARVEFHHDGGLVLASRTWPKDVHLMASGLARGLAVDLVNLIAAADDHTGSPATHLVRLDVRSSDDTAGLSYIDSDDITLKKVPPRTSEDDYVPPRAPGYEDAVLIPRFQPVDITIPAMTTREDRVAAATAIATDICTQFGVHPKTLGLE